jgi:hypothetical protein
MFEIQVSFLDYEGEDRFLVIVAAIKTARIPVRKIPSNVPAPPMEATGAPSPVILPRFKRSA